MEEGGECLMDQFKSIHGARFCHQFYPWFEREAPYTLHVQFERRPRKFNDREAERRFRRHRFGRQATREVASFQCAARAQDEYTTQVPLQG
ncbi:hypothetical protein M3Y99_00846600 [Aphelenchoides fujianensis]|nr:hypothetical protein M3Y99_00846600 [Aphelenchoides fujianensis]